MNFYPDYNNSKNFNKHSNPDTTSAEKFGDF